MSEDRAGVGQGLKTRTVPKSSGTTSGGDPEQLDLLDWIAAQPVDFEPTPVLPAPARWRDPADPDPLLLTRVDSARNMRRFYSLALVTSLFGEAGVSRQWGRIGSQGRSRTDWHESLEAARTELESMAEGKQRRGYR